MEFYFCCCWATAEENGCPCWDDDTIVKLLRDGDTAIQQMQYSNILLIMDAQDQRFYITDITFNITIVEFIDL